MSSEYIWETFDSLFKTVHRQGKRVEELENRVSEMEKRLESQIREVEQVSDSHDELLTNMVVNKE